MPMFFVLPLLLLLQSAYGDVKVRLELPPGVSLVRSTADAEGMQISTVSLRHFLRQGVASFDSMVLPVYCNQGL